ncbi:hypothetical protein RM553_12715 [Zunongwangia sp. F363]|uniref:Uncharacterized protein n=1 Tax=Autumnicola tepida TaxID=3075595 RepID=A0ABU3CBI4_9FLAO|nr:hypothetical protein [Zunongwangia sp. F363]MDT0643697.1 hypothetical protein [Zunongwangia sp. F363]
MKFGKITSKTASSSALTLGGAVAGGAVSGGIVAMVPAEQKTYARAGIVAAGTLGAAAVKGTTTGDQVAKFLLLGMAFSQGAALIKEAAAKQMEPVTESTTTANKFVAGMVGLACPCDEQRPMLAAPVINFDKLPAQRPTPQIQEVYKEAAGGEASMF